MRAGGFVGDECTLGGFFEGQERVTCAVEVDAGIEALDYGSSESIPKCEIFIFAVSKAFRHRTDWRNFSGRVFWSKYKGACGDDISPQPSNAQAFET